MFMLLFELVTSKTLRINSTREPKPLKSQIHRALLPRTTSNMSLETTVRSRCMSVSHRSSKAAYQNIIPIRSWDVILLVILSAADASRTSTTSALCSWIDSRASISHLFQRRPQQERRMMLSCVSEDISWISSSRSAAPSNTSLCRRSCRSSCGHRAILTSWCRSNTSQSWLRLWRPIEPL